MGVSLTSQLGGRPSLHCLQTTRKIERLRFPAVVGLTLPITVGCASDLSTSSWYALAVWSAERDSGRKGGRGFSGAILSVAPCSILPWIYEGMGGVMLSGPTDREFVMGSTWYPIVPTDQSVSSWVTR